MVLFEEGTVDEDGIGPYNRSAPSRIRLFVTARKSRYPCFCLFSSILASLSLFSLQLAPFFFLHPPNLKLEHLDHRIEDQYAELVVFFSRIGCKQLRVGMV